METQDVPEVLEMPRLDPYQESPVAFADFVLTALLRREAGVLNAEHRNAEDSVGWFILPPGLCDTPAVAPMAVSPSRGAFRCVLARIGMHYMGSQLYGGYALRFLRQRERVHRCRIYMSNNGQSGFWLEIYSGRLAIP